MGTEKRKPIITPSVSRTIERIAIAALGAVAARGSEKSIAVTVIAIFIIVVAIEELGRSITIRGKQTTLRAVALTAIRERRFLVYVPRRRRRRRKRRSTSREVASDLSSSATDTDPGEIQE